jgi:TctA family transporter
LLVISVLYVSKSDFLTYVAATSRFTTLSSSGSTATPSNLIPTITFGSPPAATKLSTLPSTSPTRETKPFTSPLSFKIASTASTSNTN